MKAVLNVMSLGNKSYSKISRYRDILKTREKMWETQEFKKIDPLI